MTDTNHKNSSLSACRFIDLPRHEHENGCLTVVEDSAEYPFDVKRIFYLYDVPCDSERGGHSHRQAQELIVAVSGSFSVTLDDGAKRKTFFLDRPFRALYVPAGIWRTLENFSSGSICLVLTSEKYSEEDYVRSYGEFLELTSSKRNDKKIKYPFLNLATVNAPYMDALKAAACRVIESGCYVGGAELEALEKAIAQRLGCKYAVGVSNGLDALRLIFRAYIEMGKLQQGDEVIVPANTYIASVLAVTDNGLKPVLVEPSILTLNLDTAKIEAAITPRTKAILPVHLYGRACWDETLKSIAEKYGLLVVEDTAQAIGAESQTAGFGGVHAAGALGHASGISFYPTKNLGALGEAGIVTTDDEELASVVKALRNYGSDRQYHNLYKGLNCRLDPMQAALLMAKLPYLDKENAHRRELAKVYNAEINNPAVVKPLYTSFAKDSVWHQYVVMVENRDHFRAYLSDNGVETAVHYPTPPHLQPCYKEYSHLSLPISERIAAQAVSLPITACTSAEDALQISKIINDYAS